MTIQSVAHKGSLSFDDFSTKYFLLFLFQRDLNALQLLSAFYSNDFPGEGIRVRVVVACCAIIHVIM